MRILLTGATGFVGRALLQRLLAGGHRVRVLVRDPARLPPAARRHQGLETRQGSLEREAALAGAARGVGAVIHVAGLVAARRVRDYHRVNVAGTGALLRVCLREAPEARWIQVSSLAATGPGDPVEDRTPPRPVSEYGRSKLLGEQILRASGLRTWTVLRPPAVYGPGDRAFLPFFRAAARGLPCAVPWPGPRRLSFLHVGDLAEALAGLAEGADFPAGEVFHVAGPEAVGLREFLDLLARVFGRRARPLPVPLALGWPLAWVLSPSRVLLGVPRYLSPDKLRELGAAAWHCRAERFREQTGWRPAWSLEEGLRDTARAYHEAGLLPAAPVPAAESRPSP